MSTSTEVTWAAILRGKLARTAQVVLLALGPLGAALAQVPPFEEAAALSTDVVPIERTFNVPQSGAGKYRITLTDLGQLLTVPASAPLASVHLLVTRGSKAVVSLHGIPDDASAVDTVDFDATPGDYQVHIVGKPGTGTGSGPVGLKIANVATSNPVLDFSATLAPPPAVQSRVRTYQVELDVPADGAYDMKLADLAFPHAGTLKSAGFFLFKSGAASVAACANIPVVVVCPITQNANLTAGHYVLVAAGGLDDAADGAVFSVDIRSSATGAVLHSRTVEIGRVKRVSDSSFQLNAGNYTLSLKDLEFPAKLGEVAAVVTRAAQVTALTSSTTADATFTVAADQTAFDVLSYATPDATAGAGSYDVEVRPAAGAAALSSVASVDSPTTGGPSMYTFGADITTAGTYRARLGDFQFPAALNTARVAIVQNGVVIGKTDPGAGSTQSLDVALAAGRATAIVLAKPAMNGGTLTQSGGTFGLELGVVGGTQLVLDATQGVGGLVSVRKVSILQAGRYDLTVSDLDFPEAFHDLMVVVSRGAQKLGTVLVGSGGTNPQGGSATLTDFDATAGNYSITLIALPSTTTNAATYGISFVSSPPAPTVTLTATPTSVAVGTSTGLTWTSQGATSCSASSNPAGAWSGTKATSGTEGSAAITGATTFTLRCTDAAGRSGEKAVSVTIAAAQNNGGGGGGGGALDWLTLATLMFGAAARAGTALRRRARQA